MPCPFFLPEEPLDASGWVIPPRAPLGKAWTGTCCADPSRPTRPNTDALWKWCNFGYARGVCPQFPEGHTDDAVRFATVAGKLQWIVESDHVPVRFGEVNDATPKMVRQQADAFRR
jgi:hypothetical protein